MNNNVRLIAPTGPTGAFKSVNVVTTEQRTTEYQSCTQVTAANAAAQPGTFPTLVVAQSGADAAFDDNRLQTILVTGYSAPN